MPSRASFKYFQISISRSGKYYFTFSQPDKRYNEVEKVQFISMLLFRAEWQDSDSSSTSQRRRPKLSYIEGRCHDIRDLFVKGDLEPGNYLLFVNFAEDPEFIYEESGSMNVYGPEKVDIAEIGLRSDGYQEKLDFWLGNSLKFWFNELGSQEEWTYYSQPYHQVAYRL